MFEPNRGLWDKFILVMDFNPLYPQEYNIDFTTVEPAEEEAGVCNFSINSLKTDPHYTRMTTAKGSRSLRHRTFLKESFVVLLQP